jgi:hypothetical protein
MQQRFATREYSVREFEEWNERGELVLQPKFQRRDVWTDKARSYLIDTVIRGKPIPKIYMRQDIDPKTRRVTREIVDGQQRLRCVLDFLKDGFKIIKTHNEQYGGKYFSQLDKETQLDILRYEFVVDLLRDMPDREVYDVFARLNTYSMTLNAQELRHSQYFGEFRTAVYGLANEFMTFWQRHRIFSDRQILRMVEAEFVSELLIAMSGGIRAKSKPSIDIFYRDHDDRFPRRKTFEERFRQTIDAIGGIMGDTLAHSRLREPRLLYPLFCAVYHMQFELPELTCDRIPFKSSDYPKLRSALGKVDEIFLKREKEMEWERRRQAGESLEELLEEERQRRIDAGEAEEEVNEEIEAEAEKRSAGEFAFLTGEERRFYDAYNVHWVHGDRRKFRTEYICKLMVNVLRG